MDGYEQLEGFVPDLEHHAHDQITVNVSWTFTAGTDGVEFRSNITDKIADEVIEFSIHHVDAKQLDLVGDLAVTLQKLNRARRYVKTF